MPRTSNFFHIITTNSCNWSPTTSRIFITIWKFEWIKTKLEIHASLCSVELPQMQQPCSNWGLQVDALAGWGLQVSFPKRAQWMELEERNRQNNRLRNHRARKWEPISALTFTPFPLVQLVAVVVGLSVVASNVVVVIWITERPISNASKLNFTSKVVAQLLTSKADLSYQSPLSVSGDCEKWLPIGWECEQVKVKVWDWFEFHRKLACSRLIWFNLTTSDNRTFCHDWFTINAICRRLFYSLSNLRFEQSNWTLWHHTGTGTQRAREKRRPIRE